MRPILCLFAALSVQAATPLFDSHSDSAWTPVRGFANPDASVRHNSNKSLRLEASPSSADASAESPSIHLTIGKTYEVSGWVRTVRRGGPGAGGWDVGGAPRPPPGPMAAFCPVRRL